MDEERVVEASEASAEVGEEAPMIELVTLSDESCSCTPDCPPYCKPICNPDD